MANTQAELVNRLVMVAVNLALSVINEIRAEKGELPTDEEVRARLSTNVQKILADGEAWKASKGLS